MRSFKAVAAVVLVSLFFTSQAYAATSASNARDVIWQGLLGAGIGAISAEVSGGKAGMGALIGAGTNVIGGALLSLLTQPVYAPPAPRAQIVQQPVVYQQPITYQQPIVYQQPVAYHQPEPVYVQPTYRSYYSAPVYEDPNRKILKSGLMGAGVGAISSYASGGKGGRGALVGAGTHVIGGALLELLSQQ